MGESATLVFVVITGTAILAIVAIFALVSISFRASDQTEQASNPDQAPCPKCRELLPLDSIACPFCGAVLKAG